MNNIFGDRIEFKGEGGAYHARLKSSSVSIWLESKLIDWTYTSRLGNELISTFGGTSARVIIRESTGITGKTLRKQLESLFAGRVETRGAGGGVEMRLIQPKSSGSEISKETAESHILDLFAIDSNDRFEGRDRNKITAFIKRVIRPIYNTDYRRRDWNWLKYQFKELTNTNLEDIFPIPTSLCDYIESRHNCLFAKFTSNTITIIVTNK